MKVSIIDWIVKKLKKCIGIVEDGDTASSAISKGQYVVWKGSLYTADGAISSGTTLSASGGSKNLTAVTDGGLNSLNSKIATLVKKTRTVTTTDSDGDAQALDDITQKAILSVIPVRNAGNGTYTSWFGVIIGAHSGTGLSIKCVNDSNAKLASTKVAMDVYYIEQTFS